MRRTTALFLFVGSLVALLAAAPARAGGIGAIVEDRPWGVVLTPLPGSPAEKAGLKPEDVLVSVDGAPPGDADGAVGHIRGDDGTPVHLTVRRGTAIVAIDIVRAPGVVPAGGVPVTLALSRHGLLVILANSNGDGWSGLRVGDQLMRIDKVAPTSVDDAMARLAGPAGSDAYVSVLRFGILGPMLHHYHVQRLPTPPPPVSPAEAEFRAARQRQFVEGDKPRRSEEDHADYTLMAQGNPGVNAYVADMAAAARAALGTDRPQGSFDDPSFCRSFFALLDDYEHGFASHSGAPIADPGSSPPLQVRDPVPGMAWQLIQKRWWGSGDSPLRIWKAVVRWDLPLADARVVLDDVHAHLVSCAGPPKTPNFSKSLYGFKVARDDNRTIRYLIGAEAPYDSDHFLLEARLVKVTERGDLTSPAMDDDSGRFRVVITMEPK